MFDIFRRHFVFIENYVEVLHSNKIHRNFEFKENFTKILCFFKIPLKCNISILPNRLLFLTTVLCLVTIFYSPLKGDDLFGKIVRQSKEYYLMGIYL